MLRTKFTFTDANWLESVRQYVLDVEAKILDLHHSNLTVEDIKSVLEFLAESEVSELDLSYNNLENLMMSLSKLLIKTKIRKLNLSSCKLFQNDVMKLMQVLKDSQITELNISGNKYKLRKNVFGDKFMCHLAESHLTSLTFCGSTQFNQKVEMCYFIDVLCNTSITHLKLDGINDYCKCHDGILSLFPNLKNSAITHLSLASNNLDCCESLNFGDSIRTSKLIELDLSKNQFSDQHVDELFKALVGTQITSLNLASSSCHGSCNIFSYLKETKLTRLEFSQNIVNITSDNMFDFPNFLSNTSVVSLNLQGCGLTDEIGVKIMSSLKSSKLEELDVSCNLFKNATVLEFYRTVSDTTITSVNFGGDNASFIRSLSGSNPHGVANFFETLKNSGISSVKLRSQRLGSEAAKIAFPNLTHSKLTHLDLASNYLGGGLPSLAAILKFTTLTHLNLESNCINDNNVEALAACFKDTQIISLKLGRNEITNAGAEALALSLKGTDILYLDLNSNQIENPGLHALASSAVSTFITVLNVRGNPGNGRMVETVTWNNRKFVLQFVRFFKRVAPENGTKSFQFETILSSTDVDTFREECLNFYSVVTERSSAALVLSQDEKVTLSRDQITALLFEEFPTQFVEFIVTKIEVEISERINFLNKVEEMGLTRIVELLLLNRSVYTINQFHGILHPYVYQLLCKYKLPICDLDVEPRGIERIVEYFTEFSYIEDSADVIRMLRNEL